ncbi:MAG TPA: hypothetical protein PLK63_03235 [Catalimonadaceae bacterium]|nr:hypothetical protein [Catalimonadaceae bacterium]
MKTITQSYWAQKMRLNFMPSFCPYPNAHIRLESRGLYTRQDEMIFSYYSKPADYRTELLASMGIWF